MKSPSSPPDTEVRSAGPTRPTSNRKVNVLRLGAVGASLGTVFRRVQSSKEPRVQALDILRSRRSRPHPQADSERRPHLRRLPRQSRRITREGYLQRRNRSQATRNPLFRLPVPATWGRCRQDSSLDCSGLSMVPSGSRLERGVVTQRCSFGHKHRCPTTMRHRSRQK